MLFAQIKWGYSSFLFTKYKVPVILLPFCNNFAKCSLNIESSLLINTLLSVVSQIGVYGKKKGVNSAIKTSLDNFSSLFFTDLFVS